MRPPPQTDGPLDGPAPIFQRYFSDASETEQTVNFSLDDWNEMRT